MHALRAWCGTAIALYKQLTVTCFYQSIKETVVHQNKQRVEYSMKKFLLTILVAGLISPLFGQSYISKAYCALLGNTDIKKEYKDLVHQALREYGVVGAEQVAVKKMNRVGHIIALMPVASFTAFGIWFDEEYLDTCSPEERIFQIYHEAAHYAQQHHQKALMAITVFSGVAAAGLIILNKIVQNDNNFHSRAVTASVTAMTAAIIYLGILPRIIKHQERDADLEACKQLIAAGRTDIVNAYIQTLRSSGSAQESMWWFSELEQADYLEQAIQ